MPFNQSAAYKRHISFRDTKLMRGVFIPPIINRCLLSQHIYEQEMCQIISVRSISLDMSAQPSVLRSNDDTRVSIMPFTVTTSTDEVLHSLNKRVASMNHVLNQYQMYPSVLRTIRAMCEKPFSQKSVFFF